ncbi:MAG: SH3 domain-containing protein [Aggregatilineales bacterium]
MLERIVLIFSGVLVLAVFSPSMFSSAQGTPNQAQVPTATPPPASSNSSDSGEEVYVSSLPDRGVAPEIQSLAWLNSDVPLRLEDLRGQVVLLEFWTFDCINCIRTLPYIEQWHQTYQDQGLVVIGIHYPEFNYERDLHNISAATARLNVSYAVGQDNDGLTWRAYNQRYWPTTYLIDKRGNIRYLRIGEGNYQQTEAAINDLLAETYVGTVADTIDEDPLRYLTTDVVLNVRNGAGISNGQIGTILPGMAFVILDEEDGWYQIRYNDDLGYVSGEYVTVVE